MQYLLFSNVAKSVRYLKRSVVKSENSKIVSNIFFSVVNRRKIYKNQGMQWRHIYYWMVATTVVK